MTDKEFEEHRKTILDGAVEYSPSALAIDAIYKDRQTSRDLLRRCLDSIICQSPNDMEGADGYLKEVACEECDQCKLLAEVEAHLGEEA